MTIVIFSRPIRSGKTTELQAWCAARPAVRGVLMPDISGARFFQAIETGERWPAAALGEADAMAVGRFSFSSRAFQKAVARISESRTAEWLVIDEIGKLELEDRGFGGVLQQLTTQPPGPRQLLLVVRDSLLEAVIQKFGLQGARIVHALDEIQGCFTEIFTGGGAT